MNSVLINQLTGLGTDVDKLDKTKVTNPVLLSTEELASLYKHWVTAKFVDVPAKEAIRNGREHETPLTDKQKELLIKHDIDEKLTTCLIIQRLFGGCLLFVAREGVTDYSQPLGNETKPIKFITPFPQFDFEPIHDSLIENPTNINYGKHQKYKFIKNDENPIFDRGHFIIFEGEKDFSTSNTINATGYNKSHFYLGLSLVQKSFEAIYNAIAGTNTVATLLIDSKIDVLKVEGLIDLILEEDGQKKIEKRVAIANSLKSIHRGNVIDKEEGLERIQTDVEHYGELLREFFIHLSGASNIPLTKFLGIQTKGLGNTNEGDLQNYYQMLESIQNHDLYNAYSIIDKGLGIKSPFKFNPVGSDSDGVLMELDHKASEIVDNLSEVVDENAIKQFLNEFTRLSVTTVKKKVAASGGK